MPKGDPAGYLPAVQKARKKPAKKAPRSLPRSGGMAVTAPKGWMK